MNNNLVNYENNTLGLTADGIKLTKQYLKAKAQVDILGEQLKQCFKENMEQYGVKKFIANDGSLTATYVAETTSNTFDSKRFKEENPDLYNQYLKPTSRKAYVKLS